MFNVVLLSLVFFFNYLGMSWLAISLKSHWRQLHGETELRQRRIAIYRTLGGLALTCSLILCLWVDNPSIAFLVWIMSVTATAKAVAFTLSYHANWLKFLSGTRLPLDY